MRTALTIAGADPSGWAGIQSDIMTFDAFGVRGLSAIAALTAQNSRAVKAVLPVPAAFLMKEITVLLEEFKIDAVKIGMLGSSGNVTALSRLIGRTGGGKLKNIVLDPILRSTGGFPMIDRKGVNAILNLLPLVTAVTPNIPEASALSGIRIKDTAGMEAAAIKLYSLGAPNVLIKGGHLLGAPVDILYDGRSFRYYEGRRIKGRKERFHGTGCMLSAAIAANLAKGKTVKKAVEEAKGFVERRLKERRFSG